VLKVIAGNWLTLFFLISNGILVGISFTYGNTTRMFPMAIGILTFIMLALLLIAEITHAKWLSFVFGKGISSGVSELVPQDQEGENHNPEISAEEKAKDDWKPLVMLIILLCASIIVLYAAGYLVSAAFFLILFLKFFANKSWSQTLLITAIMEVGVYLIFYIVLKVH
jgi:hypothetical protein